MSKTNATFAGLIARIHRDGEMPFLPQGKRGEAFANSLKTIRGIVWSNIEGGYLFASVHYWRSKLIASGAIRLPYSHPVVPVLEQHPNNAVNVADDAMSVVVAMKKRQAA
jgi:hypothetical protein